ncbi:MAG: response regulator [Chloroflexota bacterium]
MATIAILEDEPALRVLFQRVLERSGHAVVTYGDGVSALAGILADPPAVFVTDFHVPGLTGLEVVARLRADPRTAAVRCILLTGSGEPDVVGSDAVGDYDACLAKPVEIDRLVEVVEACLSTSKRRSV